MLDDVADEREVIRVISGKSGCTGYSTYSPLFTYILRLYHLSVWDVRCCMSRPLSLVFLHSDSSRFAQGHRERLGSILSQMGFWMTSSLLTLSCVLRRRPCEMFWASPSQRWQAVLQVLTFVIRFGQWWMENLKPATSCTETFEVPNAEGAFPQGQATWLLHLHVPQSSRSRCYHFFGVFLVWLGCCFLMFV